MVPAVQSENSTTSDLPFEIISEINLFQPGGPVNGFALFVLMNEPVTGKEPEQRQLKKGSPLQRFPFISDHPVIPHERKTP